MDSDKADVHDAAAGPPKPDQSHGQSRVEVTVNEQKVKVQKPEDSKNDRSCN